MIFLRRRGAFVLAFLLVAPGIAAAAASAPQSPATLPSAFADVDDVPLPDPDLWQRIRMGFRMEPMDSPLVAEHEAWYSSRPEYIKRFCDRGSLYLHYIVEQVEKRGMPMEIALLPVIESAFNPLAYSRGKASGIWQFIPSTGKNFGLKQDWWKDNRRDIIAATDAALNYLQRLHDMFGSWELALAAYNCGEGCVSRAIAHNVRKGLPTDLASLKLPAETTNYVPKLIAVKNIVLSPASYGIDLESVPDEPYFTTVQAPPKIDVKVAAQLAGMSQEDFVALNPAHTKPVAAGSSAFIVPVDKADTFRENLESYDKPLVSWTTYSARKGESFDMIARKHHLTAAQLKAANSDAKLDKRGRLRAATMVMVPIAGKGTQPVKVASLSTERLTDPAPAAAPASHSMRFYTVRPGDTLYGIALRYRTHVDTILEMNRLTAGAMLHPGLKLRVP